jgi:protein-S-isoprenylcysteine O-methyltransferase Ste14
MDGLTMEPQQHGASPSAQTSVRRRPEEKRGLRALLFDLRHRRRRFRQAVGVVFVVLLTWLGEPRPLLLALGAAVALLGMVVRMWASGFVMKNEVLATHGPYAYVRHPLYVGNVLICLGFVLASGLWWSPLAAIALLVFFYPQTIRYEDQKLRRLFPDTWDRWASEVRALWPRVTPYRAPGESREPVESRWSLRLSMVRNGEPLHVILLVACLVFLYRRLG